MSKLKAAKGIRKLIIGLRRVAKGKNARVARTASKTADKVGKSAGMLARMRNALIVGSLLKGSGGSDDAAAGSNNVDVGQQGGNAGIGSIKLDDPEINLAGLPASLEALTPIAERTDLTLIEDAPLDIKIPPQEIVENYFDDNYTPVKIESAIKQGTEINAISNSIGALAAQTAAMNTLSDSVDDAVDENRRTKRQNERRRDEEAIEKKEEALGPMQALAKGSAGLSNFLEDLLTKLAFPAIALGFAQLAKDFEPDDPDATLGEVVEDNLGWLDNIEEKYTQIAIGLGALGGNIKRGMAQIAVNMIDKFSDWKLARIEKAMAIGPQQPSRIARMAESIAQVRAWAPKPNTKAMRAYELMKGFTELIGKIIKPFTGAIANVTSVIGKMGAVAASLFKGFLAKPVRWMAAFYALVAIKDAALSWALQMITEEEFHKRTKANLREFMQIIGGTWIICTIFSILGTGVGTLVIPFFGTLTGSLLGVAIGVLFGESLWKIIGADEIVAAMYDAITSDKEGIEAWKEAFAGIGGRIMSAAKAEFERIGQVFKDTMINAGEVLGLVDRVATTEELAEEYGEDATLTDIAIESMDRANKDENAIFHVADSITSQEHLEQVNKEMVEKTGMTLREYAHENLRTQDERDQFDAYLDRALAGNGGSGIDIRNEMKEEFVVVVDGEEKVYTNFQNARSAAGRNGKITRRKVYDPSLASERPSGVTESYETGGINSVSDITETEIYPETYENVAKLQTAFSDSDPVEKFEGIMSTAIEVAEDGNYEQVKKVYEESTGRALKRDLENIVGEENAEVIDTIMKGDTNQVAEVVSEAAMTEMLERYMPNVSSEIKEKATQIIPIVMNQMRGPQNNRSVVTGASGFGSLPDSASPNFDTSDSFMSEANFYQT